MASTSATAFLLPSSLSGREIYEDSILAGRPLVRYPESRAHFATSRPPQLETPAQYFDRTITPNEAFFVRYHAFPIPTSVDLATSRLNVTGHVERPLALSMEDLQTKFSPARVVAVNQCSATAEAASSRACSAGNGETARWATPSGWRNSRWQFDEGRCEETIAVISLFSFLIDLQESRARTWNNSFEGTL